MNDKSKNYVITGVVTVCAALAVSAVTAYANIPSQVQANTDFRIAQEKRIDSDQKERITLAATLARMEANQTTLLEDVKQIKASAYAHRE